MLLFRSTHWGLRLQATKTKTKTTEAKPGTKAEDPDKYKNYFHFEYGINGVRPHQVQFVIAYLICSFYESLHWLYLVLKMNFEPLQHYCMHHHS